jgi:hypothetical protein
MMSRDLVYIIRVAHAFGNSSTEESVERGQVTSACNPKVSTCPRERRRLS